MIFRVTVVFLVLKFCVQPLFGADTRDELVAEISIALKNHDRAAFEKCVNFDGTEESVRSSFRTNFEDPILAYVTPYVFTSERIDEGEMHQTKGDKHYTENGDWSFLLDIYMSKPPSKGFVLLAGMVGGKCKILLPVLEHL